MIKLIITDLDGTFLNNQGHYDRPLFAEIHALMKAKGIHFAACTGKQCERVEELFGDFSQDLWIIGDSATRIKRNGDFIFQSRIDNGLGLRIIETLQKGNAQHVIIACTDDGAMILSDTPQYLKDKVRQSYTRMAEVDDLASINTDFVKISIYDEAGGCPQIRTRLDPYENHVYIVVSEAAWIDIAPQGVHKGTTVQKLQQLLHISPHETMAFGDGYNDIELLSAAEYSFAMRHAFEATKAVANFVIGSNDESAVQHTIKRMLALQA